MMLSWGVIGVSILLVVIAGIALCWQVLRRREVLTAFQGCQGQVKEMQARTYQQEAEIRELTAGLRAEKAHVEQLQRQVKFANGLRAQLQSDL
jgi:DNA recombination protein RmuC